jgi:hypothetical protein
MGDGSLLDSVPDSVQVVGGRVGLVEFHGYRVLLNDRVVVTIDGGIETDREEVLMIARQNAIECNISLDVISPPDDWLTDPGLTIVP